jgi:Dyp-type peroxidase family
VETNDIQGNIVAGFNTRFEAFVALAFRAGEDRAKGARWIGSLAPQVSTVDDVRGSREVMKDPANNMAPWLAVAIGKSVIDAVQPSVMLDDLNFNRGMELSKLAIGDETLPADWVLGGPNHPVDLLLIIAANDRAPVEVRADELAQQASVAGLDVTYRETGVRLPNEIEHFGFKDGVSQPEIAGDRSPSGILPGHFVFGYPGPNGQPAMNQVDAIGLTKNGSLLVFRRLAQDVGAFREFFVAESARLLPQWPGLTRQHLAALIVGRWPSGAPVSATVPTDPGPGPDDNAFDFLNDPAALHCPFGAHIRKVNPREGDRDVVDVPRILRRGIPFGPLFEEDPGAKRGLLFVAYQSSLKRQFVFISGRWMNTPNLPHDGSGIDLLVGRALGARSMPINGPTGTVVVTFDKSHWIKPTGGAYLFAPGRNGLAMLDRPSIPPHFLVAAQALVLPTDFRDAAVEEVDEPEERDGRLTTRRVGTIRTLEEAHWPGTRLTPEGATGLSACRDLRHLDLAGEHFPTQILDGPGVKLLAECPGLARLSVHAAAVPASVLRTTLANLPLLTTLDLRGVDVADNDVAAILLAHPNLTALSLGATTEDRGPHRFHSGQITTGVISRLGSLRSLRSLSLRGLPLDDTALAPNGRMLGSLEELDAGETDIGDETLRQLAPPARVRRLWLDRTGVTNLGISLFAESEHLRDLDISGTAVTGSAIDPLLAGPGLSRLVAVGLNISDASLPSLAKAGSLTDVNFAGSKIGDQTVTAIARLPSLERLSIASTRVTSRGLAALWTSSVIDLDVRGLNADRETFGALLRMPRLRELQLTFTESDWTPLAAFDGGLSMTAPAPQEGPLPAGLQDLTLTSSLTPELCQKLSQLDHLETLSIRGGAEHFLETGEDGFPKLRRVIAESSELNDSALDLLGRVPNLESLFISGNAISASVVRLAAPHLHTLELRDTSVDDRAIEALARLPRLHCLDLPGTLVTADGIAALVPAARNLQSFALDGKQLTREVARVLADSATLVEIYLYGPTVTDEVLARLAPVLRLRELNVYGTTITDASAPALIALIGLRTLRIFGSSHTQAFVDRIRDARPEVELSAEINPSTRMERSRRGVG